MTLADPRVLFSGALLLVMVTFSYPPGKCVSIAGVEITWLCLFVWLLGCILLTQRELYQPSDLLNELPAIALTIHV